MKERREEEERDRETEEEKKPVKGKKRFGRRNEGPVFIVWARCEVINGELSFQIEPSIADPTVEIAQGLFSLMERVATAWTDGFGWLILDPWIGLRTCDDSACFSHAFCPTLLHGGSPILATC